MLIEKHDEFSDEFNIIVHDGAVYEGAAHWEIGDIK